VNLKLGSSCCLSLEVGKRSEVWEMTAGERSEESGEVYI